MKLKKLFLASIAVAAMTACSNETEFLDNGKQTVTEDASMQFGIALPKGALSRAGGDEADKTTEKGSISENAFQDITIVIDYNEVEIGRKVLTFQRSEFTESEGENNQMLYLRKSISVAAGEATVSAFVNASGNLKEALGKKGTVLSTLIIENNYVSDIDDLTKEGGIAEENKFLMSGSKADQKFTEGKASTVNVPVDRVAAKLVEKSQADAFIIKDPTVSPTDKSKLAITLTEYNFANLAQNTYVLNSADIKTEFFNAYTNASFTEWEKAYKTPKTITGGDINNTSHITYCTENKTTTTTYVLYKAVAKWGDNEVGTFYVDGSKKVFLSFEELLKTYTDIGLTEDSSIEAFSKQGIKKYVDGVCYYKSNKLETITRNNVYYLNVTSIKDLGEPTPGDTPKESTINLTVGINPWTINLVDIEL